MEEIIIQSINNVYKTLGYGLTELIYQKALTIELRQHFKNIQTEKSVPLVYKGHEIAVLRADIIIDDSFILELKSITRLSTKEELQLRRYLTTLNISNGLLVNFGKELEIKSIKEL